MVCAVAEVARQKAEAEDERNKLIQEFKEHQQQEKQQEEEKRQVLSYIYHIFQVPTFSNGVPTFSNGSDDFPHSVLVVMGSHIQQWYSDGFPHSALVVMVSACSIGSGGFGSGFQLIGIVIVSTCSIGNGGLASLVMGCIGSVGFQH